MLATVVMQSSSAGAATTLVALDAGSLTFEQGCAMIVGQSIGTAATTGLAVIGGGLEVWRVAHIVYSLIAPTPRMGRAAVAILKRSPRIATIQGVEVVPSVAPMLTAIA